MNELIIEALCHVSVHTHWRLKWAREPIENGKTNQMTLLSKHRIRENLVMTVWCQARYLSVTETPQYWAGTFPFLAAWILEQGRARALWRIADYDF